MGCVITKIECNRLDKAIVAGLSGRLDEPVEANFFGRIDESISASTIGRLDKSIDISFYKRIDTPITASCSIICDVGFQDFVRFALESLQWIGDENNEGVIKYNTLTSSGAWSLEEVEIEELL